MRRVALILAAVLPLTLAACGDSTGPGRLIGTYNLQSINDDPIPISVGFGQQLIAGWVRIEDDDSFSASHTYRFTSQTGSTTTSSTEFSGTYTRSGNNLTLTFPNPDGDGTAVVSATWDGDRRLTVNDNFSGAWVYVR
jgi:hypothetical protein